VELGWFFIYVLPVITLIVVCLLGRTRRIGFWGALAVSLLLTPVGGFIAALVSGPKRYPASQKDG